MNKKVLLAIPWLISVVATLGSLYFSEIKQFVPCELCWYQRILMYPLVVLFAFGFLKQDRNVFLYTLPLSLGGLLIAFYHYGVQKVDFLSQNAVCTVGASCTGEYINWLGFITIPFLSLVAFAIIFVFSLYLVRRRADSTTKE